MTKQTKSNLKKPSILKQVIVVTGLFASLFGGMFAAIVGIDNFKNYYNPYLFGFTFGTFGLITGLLVSRKIKPYVILNPKMHSNYSNLTIMFSVGFIGSSMLIGHYMNLKISTLHKCDTFAVMDKEFHKGGFRRPELNILIVNIEGENRRLLSRANYWQPITVGQQVNVCIYKSPIGFDFLTLPDNK